MRKTNVLPITLLAALLMGSIYAVLPVKAGARSDVDVLFYGSQAAAYAALVAGNVDFIQWSVTAAQKTAIESNPAITISSCSENGMMEFDLNNNYTIQTYPGVRNPLHVKEFRRALSCMVDKQWIVDSILSGGGVVLNVPIPVNSISWWPDCALPENYPWKYNMAKAAEQLALAGFVDLEPDGIVNYPADWPGRPGEPNMDPLIMWVRTEDERLAAGTYFATQLAAFGVPCTTFTDTSMSSYDPVFLDRNYHIYTGAWSLGRYPTFLYPGFHSSYWFEGGANYVTGMNSSNLPNYPDYDELAYDVYYTDSIESARTAAKAAAALGWCDYVFNIPLWSYNSYVAWRTTMAAIVNEFGERLDSAYHFLNAYDTRGGPIRMGTVAAPKALNPLYSVWYFDYAVLDRVFDSLLSVNPYDLAADQPWAVQDWEVDTWIDPDPGPDEPAEKNKVTYYLRKDVGIVSPTGTFMRNLDAHDLEFSCWYTYAFDDGWNWAHYSDVHHSNVVDDYTIEFYFDDASYWFYTAPQYPILPKTELIDTLCTATSTTFTVAGNVTADTTYWLDCDVIVQVTGEDIPVDYKIAAGYETYRHVGISFDAVPPDGTYTINYYTTALDPHGYYLAGLGWTQTWYSAGPFYPISITPGVSGFASFNKNPYYWMKTPPIGETDWRWIWETPGGIPGWENPGRDGGHFKIEIYDVVKATSCFWHRGDGSYNSRYFPGADLKKEKVLQIRPDGPGIFTQWLPFPNGYENWQCVDESRANGDEDYVYTNTDGSHDSYTLGNPARDGVIIDVTVVANASLGLPLVSDVDDELILKVVIGGISYYGETHTLTREYTECGSSWNNNPATGNPWTWSDMDALEAGFKSVQVNAPPTEWKVTQVYVVITYVISKIDIFDVVCITGKYAMEWGAPPP